MMIIEDLLRRPVAEFRHFGAKPEMDPLTEEDALHEAELLDVRFDALRSMVGLLFELRTAMELHGGNTGVLVAYRVRDLRWSTPPSATDKTAWPVVVSTPKCTDRVFRLHLGMWRDAELDLTAESAAFYVGTVPGLEFIPDYGEDDEAMIRAQLASWYSSFDPEHAVFLDPAPADLST